MLRSKKRLREESVPEEPPVEMEDIFTGDVIPPDEPYLFSAGYGHVFRVKPLLKFMSESGRFVNPYTNSEFDETSLMEIQRQMSNMEQNMVDFTRDMFAVGAHQVVYSPITGDCNAFEDTFTYFNNIVLLKTFSTVEVRKENERKSTITYLRDAIDRGAQHVVILMDAIGEGEDDDEDHEDDLITEVVTWWTDTLSLFTQLHQMSSSDAILCQLHLWDVLFSHMRPERIAEVYRNTFNVVCRIFSELIQRLLEPGLDVRITSNIMRIVMQGVIAS